MFSHRNLRFRAEIPQKPPLGTVGDEGIVLLDKVPFEQLLDYDRRCFPAAREGFLRAWIEQPDSRSLVAVDDETVRGYGVVRRCRPGARIGPLFADDAGTAESLYDALAAFAPDEPVVIDVPEVNAWAMSLATRRRMHEVLARGRMYLGPAPRVDEARVYGVTTLELG